MPRLPYDERVPVSHDFAWNLFLEPGQQIHLFERAVDHPVRSVSCHHDVHAPRVVTFSSSMAVKRIAISRADVVCHVDIGSAVWTYSGPQYERGVEIPLRDLVVPVRQWFAPSVRLLPGAPAGPVLVHLSVVFDPKW